jgi:hypothetical protein
MALQEKQFDEWLDRAFRLAFFLHGNRETAKKIALLAMNKLETASNAQFKRFYYTPTGRAENSRAARSRVSLNDLQLLQRLVFVESENFEKENEEVRTEKELLKFFIKHLVRIALKRNSFYVTLGVSRILHNYATNDAMEIYNIVVQDPERVHDDYYYRSRKGLLMKELKARFGDLLKTVKVNRGEERFTSKNDETSTEIARESLKTFMPWASECAIPENFDPFADIIKPFYFDKKDPDEEHHIEIRRIHAALHPDCFSRLTDALNLPKPEEKLEIPKFMTAENYIANDDDFTNPPHLEADELQQIKDVLAAQAESRRAFAANLLRVVVDGESRAEINLIETPKVDFNLGNEAELIEIRAFENGEDLILATYLLNFGDLEKGNFLQEFVLENGQKISFDLKPSFDEFGEVSSINCAVEFFEKSQEMPIALVSREKFSLVTYLQNLGWIFKPAMTLGLILLLFGFGWFVFQKLSERENEFVQNPPETNQNNEIIIPQVLPKEKMPEEKEETEKESNSSDLLKKRGQNSINQNLKDAPKEKQNPKIEQKKKSKKEVLIITPQRELQAENRRHNQENGTDKEGILRLSIRETNDFPRRNITRHGNLQKNPGKSLNEIKQIFIEISGDEILGKQIAEKISGDIQNSGRFVITTDKEIADAALKIYVRHESDVDAPEEKMVTAIVRLVNAEGFVVYPNRKGISGWKYVGEIGKLPKRIAGDLTK